MKWETERNDTIERTVEMRGSFEGSMPPTPEANIHLYQRSNYINLSVRQGNISGQVPLTFAAARELARHLIDLAGGRDTTEAQ